MRLSVEQYHQMIRAGILGDEDRVELLEGWLVQKMTKNPPHTLATRLVRDALAEAAPPDWFIGSQDPITLDDSEPEPDVSVCRGSPREYAGRHPGASEVDLVVEVADSSLDRDWGSKKKIYARNRITTYWIVNLLENHLEVYTDPTGPADVPDYRQRRDYGRDQTVPVVLARREVAELAVSELLP